MKIFIEKLLTFIGFGPLPCSGFLWDFRDRNVNPFSYWYGTFQTLAAVWILRWLWEGTGFEWWRLPLVLFCLVAAKWCQSRHDLKSSPNT